MEEGAASERDPVELRGGSGGERGQGDGFGGSWAGRWCQGGARGSGGSGGVVGKGRGCSPATKVAVNRGGGGEMRMAMAWAVVGLERRVLGGSREESEGNL